VKTSENITDRVTHLKSEKELSVLFFVSSDIIRTLVKPPLQQ